MVELVYKFDEKSILQVFEMVSRPLKSHSILGGCIHTHIYIHMDTNTDHITPARACACTVTRKMVPITRRASSCL